MFEKMLVRIEQYIPNKAHVLEFYAGVGVIGVAVVGRCSKVTCVEIAPMAKSCFENMLHKLSDELAERMSYITGTAGEKTALISEDVGVVIVDPPRKGLDKPLLKALCKPSHVKHLIYVSCGWERFQEDCKELVEAGWKVTFAEVYLFFPGGEHIETLAVLDR